MAMKGRRSDLVKVGIFVLLTGTVLVGGLAWIAGARLFRPIDTYSIVFEDSVSGLKPGATVEYQGVAVGRVRDIELTADLPPRVKVTADLEPGTPIREDTMAVLAGSLVTGIKYIELHGGTGEAPPLPEGGTIEGEVSSLDQFQNKVTLIADRAIDVIRRLDREVFTTANAKKIDRFLTDLSTATETFSKTLEAFRTEETGKEVARLVRELSEVATGLNAIVQDFKGRRGELYKNLEGAFRDLRGLLEETRRLIEGTRSEIRGTGESVGELVNEFEETIDKLQETLDLIQSDPSLLLRGRNVPEREIEQR